MQDPVSGETWQASLFVMVLGASSYTYAEATRDQQLTAWLSSHIHAFEYFSGVPRLLIPDNPRTGVSRACRYDPDLNPTYQEFAVHYGVGVVPARPYRPRDKAKVEVGVQLVERWIIAALRHHKFFRLEEVNRAIRELLERLNQRPFRKREGSRSSVFASLERTALRSLPAERFDMSQWSRARVNIDYHIAFDANFYSVPYTLVHELVEVRAAPTTVEIFHRGQSVASHLRGRGRGQVITEKEHRPKSHQAHLEWTPSRMVHWAEQIGPHTARLFERILAERPHPEMGYRAAVWTNGGVRDWAEAPIPRTKLQKEVSIVVPSTGERWREVTEKDKHGKVETRRVHTLGDSVVRVRDRYYLSAVDGTGRGSGMYFLAELLTDRAPHRSKTP